MNVLIEYLKMPCKEIKNPTKDQQSWSWPEKKQNLK